MMDRAAALRGLDRAARLAMLAAGLGAQAAMWCADHRAFYPVAAMSLVAVTAVDTFDATRSNGRRRFVATTKFGACLALVVACAAAVVETALRGDRPPSTVTGAGIVLLIAHLVQAATVTQRRDLSLGVPLVGLMLLQSGLATTNALPGVPFAVTLCSLGLAIAWTHQAGLLEQSEAAVVECASALRTGVRQLAVAGALGALAFGVLPNSARFGLDQADRRNSATAPGNADQLPVDPGSGPLDLRVRQPLSEAPVFVTDAAAPAYWQGAVYDRYDGTSWSITNSQPATTWPATRQGTLTVQQSPDEPQSALVGATSTRTDSVQVVSTSALKTVLAPGQPTSYAGPGEVESNGSGNVSLVGAPANGQATTYQVASVLPAASPAMLASATGADPADQRWLQLPAELPSRVGELARKLANGQPTRLATVAAIEDYLRSNETYDLSAPVPAPGTDAVDDFLFTSHRGFCEQFASAAVVMLRTLGIPARLVTGYAHGAPTSDPGKIVMRDDNAHAWVQVWYPSIGWVNSDPTASTVAATPHELANARQAPAAPHPLRVTAVAGAAFAYAARNRGRLLVGATAVTLVVALLSLIVLLRRRRRSAAAKPAPVPSSCGPVLGAYLRLADEFPELRSRRDATIREAAARSGLDVTSPVAIRCALDALERECYGTGPMPRADVEAAVAVFNGLRTGGPNGGFPREVDIRTAGASDLVQA
jgi:protein-glutamine gamma-glutamyltransferase